PVPRLGEARKRGVARCASMEVFGRFAWLSVAFPPLPHRLKSLCHRAPTPVPLPRRREVEREQLLTSSLARRGALRAMIIYGKTAGKSPHANHGERPDGQADGHECP